MKRNKKIIPIVTIFIIVAWLFDFSSWFQENQNVVLGIMLAFVIGGIWWILDELEEIKEHIIESPKKDED